MKVLYFDCFSGASGDMILGALIDAGAPVEEIRDALNGLDIEGWSLEVAEVTRGGLHATHARVTTAEKTLPRTYRDIATLLEEADLPERVTARAGDAFRLLAEAEGTAHGGRFDQVHFHEVGADDAVVDVVGSMVALDHLAPDEILASPIATGSGVVQTQTGSLPLPAPAVVEILRSRAIPFYGREEQHELVTPTGAAILAATIDRWGPLPEMTVTATGYGAGSRDLVIPNALRVLVGDAALTSEVGDEILVVETNIDDMSPELVPFVIGELVAAGAQDAWVTPIVMKKGRPAITLSALVAEKDRDRVLDVLFTQTTTFGVRIIPAVKQALEREWVETKVQDQTVRVKIARRGGSIATMAPEHDDAVKAARATGISLKDVYAQALAAARDPVTRRA